MPKTKHKTGLETCLSAANVDWGCYSLGIRSVVACDAGKARWTRKGAAQAAPTYCTRGDHHCQPVSKVEGALAVGVMEQACTHQQKQPWV